MPRKIIGCNRNFSPKKIDSKDNNLPLNDKQSPSVVNEIATSSLSQENHCQSTSTVDSQMNNHELEKNSDVINTGTDLDEEISLNRTLLAKELEVDIHISRLFDQIRYSEEAVSVLPNRSWAIHCTDIPVKNIVVSEMVMHNVHGRGLEPFYIKQIVFDERLNYELFLLNSKTVLRDKPTFIGSMTDLESVLDYVESLKICAGGPDISQYNNINPECAYRDPYNKWRHNLCTLEVHDGEVCESCKSLEEILKRHCQRVKLPLKSRNGVVPLKRKRL